MPTVRVLGVDDLVLNEALPHAGQVCDPFHVVKAANSHLEDCRPRVQNDTLGHRGPKLDPLYRVRRLLTKAHERLDPTGNSKLVGLLNAGDPNGEVRTAWHAKEAFDPSTASTTRSWPASSSLSWPRTHWDREMPPKLRSLGGALNRWHDQIVNCLLMQGSGR